jgi:hypothetical protein
MEPFVDADLKERLSKQYGDAGNSSVEEEYEVRAPRCVLSSPAAYKCHLTDFTILTPASFHQVCLYP